MEVLLVIAGIVLAVNMVLVFLIIFNHKKYNATSKQPLVSILLPVRNEKKAIRRCLDSLIQLDYPHEKLQILIGDDASDDNTLDTLKEYEKQYSYIQVEAILEKIGHQKGKANVLAQLAHKASGDYYFMTDADMQLPKTWIVSMLGAMKDETGLVIGTTCVANNEFQNMEWIHALSLVKAVSDLGHHITGMGNNMVASKEAYWSVGGYENIPFSITEDYELFKQIKDKNYPCKHVFSREALGITLPITGLQNLLNQRKRWMQGAVRLPWYYIILLLLPILFYISVGILSLFNWYLAAVLIVAKVLLQCAHLLLIKKRLGLRIGFVPIVLFDFYNVVITLIAGLYFLLPFRVVWKGRYY